MGPDRRSPIPMRGDVVLAARRGANLRCDALELARPLALRIPAAAHRGRRQQLASTRVANYEVAIRKGALNADAVPLRCETDVLEGLIELIAPEGVHVVVWRAPVQE